MVGGHDKVNWTIEHRCKHISVLHRCSIVPGKCLTVLKRSIGWVEQKNKILEKLVIKKTYQNSWFEIFNFLVVLETSTLIYFDFIGWGRIVGTGKFSDVLKYLPLTIQSFEECRNTIPHFNQNMICGTNMASALDTSCQGDSGGPLVCQRPLDGAWVLQGVISHGSADCEGTEVYPVFTKVSKYINWILQM